MARKTSSARPELTGVAGVPEATLSDALVARLPRNLAPAPWDATCEAMIWNHRGGDAATEALPPRLRDHKGIWVIGGFVRYSYTPVGTYDEVFGAVVTREGRKPFGTVCFMAVDGLETLVGGRTNWAMPKTLASFTGSPDATMTATGDEAIWSVTATAKALGVKIPYKTRAQARQQFPGGILRDSLLTGAFTMKPAMVTVGVTSDGTLPEWLRPGRHLGAVSPAMKFSLAEPS